MFYLSLWRFFTTISKRLFFLYLPSCDLHCHRSIEWVSQHCVIRFVIATRETFLAELFLSYCLHIQYLHNQCGKLTGISATFVLIYPTLSIYQQTHPNPLRKCQEFNVTGTSITPQNQLQRWITLNQNWTPIWGPIYFNPDLRMSNSTVRLSID